MNRGPLPPAALRPPPKKSNYSFILQYKKNILMFINNNWEMEVPFYPPPPFPTFEKVKFFIIGEILIKFASKHFDMFTTN